MAIVGILSNTWTSISLIDAALQDQVWDFVANPVAGPINFTLPDPNWIVDTNQYPGVHIANSSVPSLANFESFPQYYDRTKWQVRQWRNGQRVKTSTITNENSDATPSFPTYEFTRKVSLFGFAYEGSNVLINAPGSQSPVGNLWGTGSLPYQHYLVVGQNRVEFQGSHYPCNWWPSPPNGFNDFVNYALPNTNANAPGSLYYMIELQQDFLAFQKAVAIVKSMPSLAVAPTNVTYVNKLSSDQFSYDTNSSYGGDVKYEWVVEKSVNNGPWQPAVGGGTDYTLLAGSLNTKGVITFAFLGPAPSTPPIRYRCTFRVVGYSTIVPGDPERTHPFLATSSKGNSGPNKDEWFFIAEVVGNNTATQTTINKTLPLLLSKVTPTNSATNYIIQTAPTLDAWKLLEIKAEVLMNATNAIKTTTQTIYTIVGGVANVTSGPTTTINIPSDPTVTLASDPSKTAWLTEMLTEHYVEVHLRTYVGNTPVTVYAKPGIGPHTFLLPVGKYDVAVKLFAKPKTILPSGTTANLNTSLPTNTGTN